MVLELGSSSGFIIGSAKATETGTSTAIIYPGIGSWVNVTKHKTPLNINTITAVGWYCNINTGGSNFNIGLYSDIAARPGSLLYQTGSIPYTGTGRVETNVNWGVSENTLYWLGVLSDGTRVDTIRFSPLGSGWDNKVGDTFTNPYDDAGVNSPNTMLGIYAIVENIATGPTPQISIAGSWKTVTSSQISIGGSWKNITAMQLSIGGSWKTIL